METESLVAQSREIAAFEAVDPQRAYEERIHLHRQTLEAIASGVDDPQVLACTILGWGSRS